MATTHRVKISGALKIGIDFDNTIINYDDLFSLLAHEKGWVEHGTFRNKKEVRSSVRRLPNGELKWQQLQAGVYGEKVGMAVVHLGVKNFLKTCRNHDVSCFVVSHKTEFATAAPHGPNLRECAMGWLEQNGFFTTDGGGILRDNVFFENTRQAKAERIQALGCTHFIDDLIEMFREPSFPVHCEKLLFAEKRETNCPGMKQFSSWQEISDFIFQ